MSTAATIASAVGAYDIAQGSLRLSDNYVLTFSGARLNVAARPIGVAADDKTRVFGQLNPALTYQVISGALVNGDAFTGSLSTPADTASPAGVYDILRGTLSAANYAVAFQSGKLTVSALPSQFMVRDMPLLPTTTFRAPIVFASAPVDAATGGSTASGSGSGATSVQTQKVQCSTSAQSVAVIWATSASMQVAACR